VGAPPVIVGAAIKKVFVAPAAPSPELLRVQMAVAGNVDGAWASKVDPASGRTYYINAVTKESRWSAPAGGADGAWAAKPDPDSGRTY
jgi:hypothetical protein